MGQHNLDLALTRCNESRYLCLMLAADYIAIDETDDQMSLNKTTPTPICSVGLQPNKVEAGIAAKTHTHSVMCYWGGFRLDGLAAVFHRISRTKRNVTSSVKKGNEIRKRLRGNTLMLVV